jgi:hypothetical protein
MAAGLQVCPCRPQVRLTVFCTCDDSKHHTSGRARRTHIYIVLKCFEGQSRGHAPWSAYEELVAMGFTDHLAE